MRLVLERGAVLALSVVNFWRWNDAVNVIATPSNFSFTEDGTAIASTAIVPKFVLLSRTALLAASGLAVVSFGASDKKLNRLAQLHWIGSLLTCCSLANEVLVAAPGGLQHLATYAVVLLAVAVLEASMKAAIAFY